MLQNKITSELQRIALFCTNNFMKLWLWLWIPFCQFTVHMLYVLLSILHCKLAPIVSQIWIATQKDDALKLLQFQFQHKWWYALKLQQRSGVQHKRMMHWSLWQRSGFQHKQWWMHSSSCSTDLDSNTKCDECTSSSLQQRSGFQHKRWWMHKVKLQQRSGFWHKRWWIHVSSYNKELDTTQKEYVLS